MKNLSSPYLEMVSNNLIVVSPRDKVPEGFTIINTTSRDTGNIGKQLSPFYLANIPIYEGLVAKNLENAWQFSKVYKEFADENENPNDLYFKWAKKGWNDSYAHRYANGKGNIPLYSYWKTLNNETQKWEEHKWDYITARKNIYFPLYAKAIIQTPIYNEIKKRLESGEKIALWDFDGYDHKSRGMTYEEVVNTPKYKCGHAFVLYGLLIEQLKIIDDNFLFDFNYEIKSIHEEKQYTYFVKTASPFSQWHPSLFTYKNLDFICAEQFMMYAKAKTFKDEIIAEKIINIENNFMEQEGKFKTEDKKKCYELVINFKNKNITRLEIINNLEHARIWKEIQTLIKSLGKEVKNFDETIWVNKRVQVVSIANREKYNQDPILKGMLMSTGDSFLVEAAPYDLIWGIGLDENTAKETNPAQWPGLNLLGNILTDLKNYYKSQNR